MLTSEPAETWRDQAACAGSEPDIFTEGESDHDLVGVGRKRRREIAFGICDRCPVVTECLDDAIAHQDVSVIRGGRVFPRNWIGIPPPRREIHA